MSRKREDAAERAYLFQASIFPVRRMIEVVNQYMIRTVRRGEVYYADLNPVVGSEEGGERPVLILSNNVGNRYGTTVIVAPITSRRRRKQYPTHLKIKSFAGLKKESTILFEQIRVIDKKRLLGYIGTLDRRFLLQAERAIHISIGLRS